MLIKPLHIGTIRDQQLRFYGTPNDDGRPDMPWHCHDDLQRCFGMPRNQRRYFLRACQAETV
jgi:hypothetical protein